MSERLMKITSEGRLLDYNISTFPDGQLHFALDPLVEVHRGDGDIPATIEAALVNPTDIFLVKLAQSALINAGYWPALNVRWLVGARMDRPIDFRAPHTLAVVIDILGTSYPWSRLRVLDVHNELSTAFDDVTPTVELENVLPTRIVKDLFRELDFPSLVIPDHGAMGRVADYQAAAQTALPEIQCAKVRQPNTGALSGFRIESGQVAGQNCLILDDICDGGGTFVGINKLLREAGAKSVHLFTTHGLYTKGPLEGFDSVHCTDSYPFKKPANVTVHPFTFEED